MDLLSKEIDRQIKNADSSKKFREHFNDWWKCCNSKCGELYEIAGAEGQKSINPDDATKWLNDQINKLNKFIRT